MEALKQPEYPDFKNDILHHLGELHCTNSRVITYSQDFHLVRTLNDANLRIDQIRNLISKDPRFPWQSIQMEIDKLYKQDPRLTGVELRITWGKKDAGHRGFIDLQITDKSVHYDKVS